MFKQGTDAWQAVRIPMFCRGSNAKKKLFLLQSHKPQSTSEFAASSGTVSVAMLALRRRRGGEPKIGLTSLTSVNSAVKLSPTDINTYREKSRGKRNATVYGCLKPNINYSIFFFYSQFLICSIPVRAYSSLPGC